MDILAGSVKTFDLKKLGERLKEGSVWRDKKRNSLVLHKGKGRHVYLVAMHALTFIPDHRTPCAVSLHVLDGRVRIVQERGNVVLRENELAMVEADTRYGVEAEEECLFVLEYSTADIQHKTFGDYDDYFDNWV